MKVTARASPFLVVRYLNFHRTDILSMDNMSLSVTNSDQKTFTGFRAECKYTGFTMIIVKCPFDVDWECWRSWRTARALLFCCRAGHRKCARIDRWEMQCGCCCCVWKLKGPAKLRSMEKTKLEKLHKQWLLEVMKLCVSKIKPFPMSKVRLHCAI